MLNKVMLIGRTGAAPEVRTTTSGALASVSLAVSESYNKNGERKENTEWLRLVFFGKLADIVGKYVKKGTLLYVEGKIRTTSWEKDGVKQYSTEVVVNEMKMLSPKDGESGTGQRDAEADRPDYDQNDLPY
jgi:single-strand DNA-binding protein